MNSVDLAPREFSWLWIERLLGVREVMGSIPARVSEFFFVPCSCHVDQFIFYTYHISRSWFTILTSIIAASFDCIRENYADP